LRFGTVAGIQRDIGGALEQVVVDGSHPPQEQRGRVFAIAQHRRVVLQLLERTQRQHQRRHEDDRDGDDAKIEPRR
jgi:hypothetical protein